MGGLLGGYKKQWVLCMHGLLLWSDRQITVDGSLDKKEKKRWENCINLTRIQTVSGIKRKYVFRAKNRKMRDEWVNGIQSHVVSIMQCAMMHGHSSPIANT